MGNTVCAGIMKEISLQESVESMLNVINRLNYWQLCSTTGESNTANYKTDSNKLLFKYTLGAG